MRKKMYHKIYKDLSQKMNKEFIIKYKNLKEYISFLKENYHINKKEYEDLEEISKLYSVRWGLLAMSFFNEEGITEEIQHYKVVYESITSTLANNCLAILELAKLGLDFQCNVLTRNTYELCFLLLVVLIDKEKCMEYFDTARKGNEYEIWSKNFRFKKLNERLEEYEKTLGKKEISFLSDWRKKQYSYYSGYMHNDFFKCRFKSYVVDQENKENLKFNLWGRYNDMINQTLEQLTDLMFFTSKYLLKIVSNKEIFDKRTFIGENERKIWNESNSLAIFIDELYIEYKLQMEKQENVSM